MSSREALLVSRSQSLRTLLRRPLADLGLTIKVVSGVKAALAYLSEHRPALIFIPIQQPSSRGFSAFTEIKNLDESVPIVLVASALPREDFQIHQKLPCHADAYLDKQMLKEKGFARTMRQLLRKPRRGGQKPGPPTPGPDSPDLSGLVRQTLDYPPAQGATPETEETDRTPADPMTNQRSEAELLREELETVKLVAGSSPFSETNMNVMRRMQEAINTRSRLETELEASVRLARELDEKLRSQGNRLRAAKDRAKALEDKLLAEARGHEERKRQLARQVEALESRMLEAKEIAVEQVKDEMQRAHQASLQDLQNRHAAESERIRAEHAEAERELLEKLDRERAAAQAARDAAVSDARKLAESEREEALTCLAGQWQKRLDLLQTAHEDAIATAGQRHREEIAALEERRRTEFDAVQSRCATDLETLRREQEQAEAKIRSHFEQDRAAALAANEAAWSRKLQELKAAGSAALRERDGQHQRDVARLKAGHEEALAAMEAKFTAGREQSSSDRDKALADLSSAWQRQLDRMKETHAAALATAEERHGEEMTAAAEEHQKEIQKLQAKAAAVHASAKEASRAAWSEKLNEMQEAHARSIESLEHKHKLQVERLSIAHEQARAARETAANEERKLLEAGRQQALSELRTEWQKILTRAEETHRHAIEAAEVRHGREMATVKAEHSKELQELQARDAEERKRVKREHAEAMNSLSEALRQEHQLALDQKNAYWKDRVEGMKEEHVRALHAERDQHQAMLDALNAAKPNPPRRGGDKSQAGTRDISKELDLEKLQVAAIGAPDDESIG